MSAEQIVGVIFAALFGACMGSFANVLILRWHEEASLLGRSHCPSCNKPIHPKHLVPIVSWLWLRGRCAYCGKKIHRQYPMVESAALLLGMIAAFRHPPLTDTLPFLFEFVVTLGLIVPVVMDLRWKELPIEYMAGLGVFAGVMHLLTAGMAETVFPTFIWLLVSVFGAIAFFGLQIVLSRGKWIGEGDVWFGGMMGAVLATPVLTGVAVYLAYLIGGVLAIIGLATGMYKRKTRIPFAPALAAGTIVTLWYGDSFVTWLTHALF